MKLALVTDAWTPQVNGVVRALTETVARLRRRGMEVESLTPEGFRTLPCPTYPEIRLALGCGPRVARRLSDFDPDAVHIATEGPIGWAARRWCLRHGLPFTTSFHTRFPDYVAVRTGLPADWFWPLIRRFHAPAAGTFAVTPALCSELTERGLANVCRWPLGVDLSCFSAEQRPDPLLSALPRPIHLSVGRVAVEKNLDAFLSLTLPGSKVVVGDGPALAELRERYPEAVFTGPLHGAELAAAYAAADVFVFPSRTDTFGLVNIEALACGLPIAAFPVAGPQDILGPSSCGTHGGWERIGAMDEDLGRAIELALTADRQACVDEAQYYDWERCTDAFVSALVPCAIRRSNELATA